MTQQALGARRLRELLERHGVRPTKSLGQSFVIDPNTTRKVVSLSGVGPGDEVVEIGAGAGSLTLPLAGAARRVVAIEADERLLAVLRDALRGVDNVEVVHGDALRLDLDAWGATHLIGNLPYNIAATLVVRVLQSAAGIACLTVMTQSEVAERLAAAPGSKLYGQLSVVVAYFARAETVMRVSRNVFYPAPRVDSSVVRIVRRPPPPVSRKDLFPIVRAAFSQRRKTLRNSLASVAGSPDAARRALERVGIAPDARAEELALEHYVAIAGALAS